MPNIDLIKSVLNKFIYAFKEEKIYSKMYFATVLTKLYEDDNFFKNTNFILLYGDLNKINRINTEYGYKVGDEVIKNTFKIISENMPNNIQFSRTGGDEFVGIIENVKKSEIEEKVNLIKEKLSEKNDVLKAEATFSVLESENYTTFAEMLQFADEDVLRQKNIMKNKTNLTKNDLKLNITENVLNFYDCLRMGKNNTFNQENMNFYKNYIREKFYNSVENDNFEGIEKEYLANHKINGGIDLTYKEAVILQKNLDTNICNIDIKNQKILKNVLSKMFVISLYNKNSNQFNKTYYQTVLERKLNAIKNIQRYDVLYFHSTGLKIANTLLGHDEADYLLREVGDNIENTFNENTVYFNKTPLEFDEESSYLLDMNAGDFMVVIPENQLKEKQINTIIKNVVSANNKLQIVCSKQNTRNFENMNETIECAKLECEMKKVDKFNLLDRNIMCKLIDKYLIDSINYYRNDNENYKNREVQQYFLRTFLESFEKIYIDKYIEETRDDDER